MTPLILYALSIGQTKLYPHFALDPDKVEKKELSVVTDACRTVNCHLSK